MDLEVVPLASPYYFSRDRVHPLILANTGHLIVEVPRCHQFSSKKCLYSPPTPIMNFFGSIPEKCLKMEIQYPVIKKMLLVSRDYSFNSQYSTIPEECYVYLCQSRC